jgi:hypothetical protein
MKHARDLKESDPDESNSKRRIVSDESTTTTATVPETIEILGDEYEVAIRALFFPFTYITLAPPF